MNNRVDLEIQLEEARDRIQELGDLLTRALSGTPGELSALADMEEQMSVLEHIDQLAINKWLVQGIYKDKWYTRYFKDPSDKHPVADKAASKAQAVRDVLEMIRKAIRES